MKHGSLVIRSSRSVLAIKVCASLLVEPSCNISAPMVSILCFSDFHEHYGDVDRMFARMKAECPQPALILFCGDFLNETGETINQNLQGQADQLTRLYAITN